MIKKLANISISIIFLSTALFAQNIKPEDVVNIAPVTKVKHTKNGTQLEINIDLSIKDTWHINANKPNDQSLTPTILKIDPSSIYSTDKITYPPPQMMKLQFSENELALYEQEAVISVILSVEKNFKKKSFILTGELQYQPCNDQTCLFPVNKPFKVEVKLN
jgi:DsbC/DsbD-like thiol-disulfide interchange protein